MKINDSYLCPECEEIFNKKKFNYCPACGNKNNLYLAPILNRKEKQKHEILNNSDTKYDFNDSFNKYFSFNNTNKFTDTTSFFKKICNIDWFE